MSRRDENSSGKRPRNKSKPLYIDNWGITDDRDGTSRRIYVRNYPPDTTLQELQNFFGVDKLEGIRMWSDYAFVQLKRPSYYTEAIQKNQSEFKRRSIMIEAWRERGVPRMNKMSKRSTSADIRPEYSPARSRSSSRGRSRSRSRDRDRGSSERQREFPLPELKPVGADSGYFNFNQNFGSTNNLQMIPSFGRSLSLPHNQPLFMPTVATNAFQRSQMWTRNIPADIQWTAQYVIEQGTARNLSLPQLQNLINYLESEKLFLQTNGLDRHNDLLPASQKVVPIPEPSQERAQLSDLQAMGQQSPSVPRHRAEVAEMPAPISQSHLDQLNSDPTEIEKQERAKAQRFADAIKKVIRG